MNNQLKTIFVLAVLLPIILLVPAFVNAVNAQDSGLSPQTIENVSAVAPESLTQLSVRLKALEVASQIDSYISEHPEKTIAQLQNDSFFKSLAVQMVGNTGYTAVIDSGLGIIYFHPQENLVGQDSHIFSTTLPAIWSIMEKALGHDCKEASGFYDWKEADGSISQKFTYIACVKSKTADGKALMVLSTTYLRELEANYYLNIYKIGEFSTFAQDSIKQKAVDVAKQLEIYIKSRPTMTVAQLQNDSYFQPSQSSKSERQAILQWLTQILLLTGSIRTRRLSTLI